MKIGNIFLLALLIIFFISSTSVSQTDTTKADSVMYHFDSTKIYSVLSVDSVPHFVGGRQAYSKYFVENARYPNPECNGYVVVSFIVEKDGQLSNVKLVRKLCALNDEEAIRYIEAMPKWYPGKIGNKAVRTRIYLSLKFEI